jgi:hypothetical protein
MDVDLPGTDSTAGSQGVVFSEPNFSNANSNDGGMGWDFGNASFGNGV